jgi:glutamyl-tRNA synthetase
MGYLPEALRNYLLRLGWSHGDAEIVPTAQAIEWFGLDAIGRSPDRFDFAKLASVNSHYLRETAPLRLVSLIVPRLERALGRALDPGDHARLLAALPGLKTRAKTLAELADVARFYVERRPIPMDDKARLLLDEGVRRHLASLAEALRAEPWTAAALEARVRDFAEAQGQKLGVAAQPLRAALTGATASPPIFEVMEVLGRDETLGRIADAVAPPSY